MTKATTKKPAAKGTKAATSATKAAPKKATAAKPPAAAAAGKKVVPVKAKFAPDSLNGKKKEKPKGEEHDEKFLRCAVKLSREHMHKGAGGPFGAVVVKDGKVIAEGWNQVTSANDPTAHGEVVAIRKACKALDNFSLKGCVLYTSCEPCPMCLGAVFWSRLDRIVFANTRAEAAAVGFDDAYIYEEVPKPIDERKIHHKHIAMDEAWQVMLEYHNKEDKVHY